MKINEVTKLFEAIDNEFKDGFIIHDYMFTMLLELTDDTGWPDEDLFTEWLYDTNPEEIANKLQVDSELVKLYAHLYPDANTGDYSSEHYGIPAWIAAAAWSMLTNMDQWRELSPVDLLEPRPELQKFEEYVAKIDIAFPILIKTYGRHGIKQIPSESLKQLVNSIVQNMYPHLSDPS